MNSMRMVRQKYTAILLFSSIISFISAQEDELSMETSAFPFVNYAENYFRLPNDSSSYMLLFDKFSNLIRNGNTELSIVHIGGSHIQSDLYTHRMRQKMQSFIPGLKGSRGLIFPYTMAKTNNPDNFQVIYTGQWISCKNTHYTGSCPLGLSGISLRLTDSLARISIIAKYDSLTNYDFNFVKVFCNKDKVNFTLQWLPESRVRNAGLNDTLGYYWFELQEYCDTFSVRISQSDSLAGDPEIYGFSLENNDPGVVYHSVGVNGATLQAYIQCSLFMPHLRALNPDFVILSIGTNEGYTKNFDPEKFFRDYCQLLNRIQHAVPGVAIMLTVPNDSYLYRRYLNHNTATMRDEIFKLAGQFNCGIWDFYTVMGGLNSASCWYSHGLMNRDKVHFSKQGYMLKGNLLFDAFIKSWENSLQESITPTGLPAH